MRLSELFRSTFVRLTALVALIAAVTSLFVFALAYVSVAIVSDAQLRQLVDTDAAGLADLFAAEGIEGLAGRIDDRTALRPTIGEIPVYALADSNARLLAGNLPAWPEGVPLDASWVERELALDGEPHRILGRALLMPGDVRLFVGRTTFSRAEALGDLRRMFALGFLAVLSLGILGGLAAARFVIGKVERMNRVFQAVRHGAIDRRAPGEARRDEFGELARHVNAMLARIERLIAAQREVNDLTAHELKAPLLRIDHTLSGDTVSPREIEAAREQLAELAELIESLMDISAVSAEIGDHRGLSDVDLAELARSTGRLFADVAEARNVSLTVNAGQTVILQGQPVQLGRLIANLVDNAVKFSPPGGRVTLEVAADPLLVVSDEGAGIPADSRDMVFNRFARGGAAMSGVPGHGLGLSFVHAVIRRHGLHIHIGETHPGADRPGARFVVSRG